MKKGLIKIMIIFTSMIIMVSGLSYFNKDKLVLKDVSGSRKAMDNITLVYTPRIDINNGLLVNPLDKSINNKEIVINKDEIKTVLSKKETIFNDITKYNKKSIEKLDFYIDENIFETDEYIGSVNITNKIENIKKRYIKIQRVNKNNNKVDNIEISLNKEFDINDDKSYIENYANFIYNNNLYIITRNIKSDNKEEVIILKVDIDNAKYELIKRVDLQEKNYLTNLKFINKDKIYLEISSYKENHNYSYFIIYDISKNEVLESDEFMNYNKSYEYIKEVIDYYVENDNLIMIIKGKNNYLSKLVYSLDDFKLVNEYKYNFKIDYISEEYGEEGIKKTIYLDDKVVTIYQNEFSINRKNKLGNKYKIEGNKPINLQIFDMKLNKILYEGELISSNKNMENKLFIVKDY